ncbi:CrcB-like protein-domain-containing protein [Mycena floridula]|nr:CrcB-like protein-domain-containing protein [Mycena floridula]
MLVAEDDDDDDALESDIPKQFSPFSIHIIALLIPASAFGLLVRLGLQALATYDGDAIFSLAYVQALGCLIMGFALRLKDPISRFYPPLYTAITTGFCGSLTTFSGWQSDIFSSWINAGQFHRDHLRDFMDGLGKTVFTLSLSLASLSFGASIGALVQPHLPSLSPPGFKSRYTVTLLAGLFYAAGFPAYFLLPSNFRHQATAAILFAFPGTLARYILAQLNPLVKSFPWGTFAANIIGTIAIAASHLAQSMQNPLSSDACAILQGFSDGYCGCLTTISTFAVEISVLKGWAKMRYLVSSWTLGQLFFLVMVAPALSSGSVEKQRTCSFNE